MLEYLSHGRWRVSQHGDLFTKIKNGRKLTRMPTCEDVLHDFKVFGPDVSKIMSLVQSQLPIVSSHN